MYDHCLPHRFGTSRNNVGVPSEGAEPCVSSGEVVAPGPTVARRPPIATRQFLPHEELPAPCAITTRQFLATALIARDTAAGTREAARLIRERRRLDMLDAIAAWDTSHGPDRAWWRDQGAYLIREWRRLYPHHWEAAA